MKFFIKYMCLLFIFTLLIFTKAEAFSVWSINISDYTGFVSHIGQYNFDTTGFVKLDKVPRYEVVKLLNYVDCQDCTMPWYGAIDRYSREWFQTMQSIPGKYFADIKSKNNVIYNKEDLYYCISYVSDNGYMNGYDLTSPVCASKFCGEYNTTYAEMIQIMSNIVSKKFTWNYIVNWKSISNWINKVKFSKPEIYKNFHIWDLTNIYSWSKSSKPVKITNSSDLNTYIKYCTYEPRDCWFDEFSKVKAGQRPVADFNFLIKEWILNKQEAESINIHIYPSGKDVLRYIYKLNQKSKCSFNDDYDGDGVLNRKDKNPYIDPNYSWSIYTGNRGAIWALQIIPLPMICPVGTKSIVYSFWSGAIDKLSWDMNGEYFIDNQMSKVYYNCDKVWQKTFTVKSYYSGLFIWISRANIFVVNNVSDSNKYSSNLVVDKLVANIWENIKFTTYIGWFEANDVDNINRYMVDWKLNNKNLTIDYSYATVGKKIVIQDIYLKNGYKLQNAVTIYIVDYNNPVNPITSVCNMAKDCPSYNKFDTLKFGDQVRAILQSQYNDNNYVYTNWREIKSE